MADVDKLFEKGSEAFNKKNWDYAIEIFKSICTMDPNHVKSRQALRMTAIHRCNTTGFPGKMSSSLKGGAAQAQISMAKAPDKKISLAQEYLCNDPMHVAVRVALGNALKDGNFTDGAITEFEHVLQNDGNHKIAMKALGDLHHQKGDTKKAIEYYSKVQQIDPTDREVTSGLKNLLALNTIKVGNMENRKDFRDSLKDKEGSSRAEQDKHGMKTGAEVDEEISRLNAQVAADPTNPVMAKTLKKMAEMQKKKKDYDAAVATLERAKALDPADGTIKMKIGDIKVEKLDIKVAAAKAAANGDVNDPAFKAAYTERVKFWVEECLRRTKDHPTDMTLKYELGRAYFAAGMIDPAVGEFQHTIKDPKRKIDSMTYLGRCFNQKKIYDLAATQFTNALALAPTTDWEMSLRYYLADSYKSMGKIEDAKGEYKKIMNIDISYKDVSKKLEELG
ncbi:MAG: hypothetical protein FD180_3321 [Planctomycetota bacterium]|nr:MAG: hypothetical protein FD180_3321 [Planctomycetota bacterium]